MYVAIPRERIQKATRLAKKVVASCNKKLATNITTTSMKGLAMGDKSKKDKDKNQKQRSTKQTQKSKATQDRNQKRPQ